MARANAECIVTVQIPPEAAKQTVDALVRLCQIRVHNHMTSDSRNPRRHAPTRRPGRPRGGVRAGERVRDYPTLTVRVPGDTRALLKALGSHMELPLWQTIRHVTVCFVRDLPVNARRTVVRRSRVG